MTPRILLAEDDDVISTIIEDALSSAGFDVVMCEDGQAAWDLLQAGDTAFDVILVDRNMPRMDGIDLLRQLKAHASLGDIPVVMETGATEPERIQEGIDAGAYYYLTKPFKPEVLVAIVKAAMQQHREQRELQAEVQRAARPFAYLNQGLFHFRSIDEGRLLANFFAQAGPEPGRIVTGLQELLVNAVEHGNLGITYAEKTALVMAGTWQDEIEARLARPEQQGRRVEVVFERLPDQVRFTIRDQGEGFDWQRYLDFDPARVFDPHGRGIAMANKLSFDTLEYQGNGNTVVATVRLASSG
jgi:CheY-like chemotaxis protein/anti-sigma regulatory factor (Ser/Thr protein kinase)